MNRVISACVHNAGRSLMAAAFLLPDPKGQAVERVRAIRDQIKAKVERLVEAEGWA
jgi:protein-tyrosine-phosphatase